MATKNIQLRLDEELKVSAENVLTKLGLDMPTALRLFLKKVVSTGAIPFRVSVEEDKFTEDQIREILIAREEAKDPANLFGPFETQEENQKFLDSLKRK